MTDSVRGAEPADAAAIAALLSQLGYPSTEPEVSRRLAYWRKDPASQVLLAVRDDQVIGCLSLHAIPFLERTGRWARVEALVIEAGERGTGAGRALIEAAEAIAREWGCLSTEVTSSRDREGAHAFYLRLGYTDICGQSGRFVKQLG